jgi:VWFA-related protein
MFVLTFNEEVRRVWGPSIAGETDPRRFGATMSLAVVARGMTAIYDGILEGLRRAAAGAHTRQVLIVVSDGDDNASRATLDEVTARVRASDAVVYTIALSDPLTREGNPKVMRQLARATGGESYRPRRVADVAAAFEAIARDIRSAYTIAYSPSVTGAGQRHTVRVYVRSQDGRALRVRTRDGYFEKRTGAAQ